MADLNKYIKMQRDFYETHGKSSPADVVGHYDFHENVPYETHLLFQYGDVRKPVFEDFSTKTAFDIACGEGRMVRRMQNFFRKVDGADISSSMIEHARAKTQDSDFWVSSGLDCGGAPSSFYDFVFCTISLQHICVFETRDKIMQDILRILKRDGKVTFQYLFSKHFPYLAASPLTPIFGKYAFSKYTKDTTHAHWRENKYNATATNSGCDVVFGQDEISSVTSYFKEYFENVDMWFHDISIGRGGFGKDRLLPETHPNSHISNEYHGTHFAFIHLSRRKD